MTCTPLRDRVGYPWVAGRGSRISSLLNGIRCVFVTGEMLFWPGVGVAIGGDVMAGVFCFGFECSMLSVQFVEILNICVRLSSAVIWFFDMLLAKMCAGFLISYISFCVSMITLSVVVSIGVFTCVGKNCAVAHTHFPPELGTNNW